VLERLGERYDHPTWAGPRLDAVSELVLTILSQNTADTNSFRAFTALRARYPTWDAVLAAPTDELVEVIRPGGLAPTKAPRIQHVLAAKGKAPMAPPPRGRAAAPEDAPRYHDELIHGWMPPERHG
jgi:endonuclease III